MSSYLRELSDEFGESTNGVRQELNRMSKAGLLEAEFKGNIKLFRANQTHPLYSEINRIVAKYMGLDKIVEDIVRKLGKVDSAYITGDYAKGRDTGVVDLVLVGSVDKGYLLQLIEKAERIIQRKIRFLILTPEEAKEFKHKTGSLLIWQS